MSAGTGHEVLIYARKPSVYIAAERAARARGIPRAALRVFSSPERLNERTGGRLLVPCGAPCTPDRARVITLGRAQGMDVEVEECDCG